MIKTSIREVIDPFGTLPEVQLIPVVNDPELELGDDCKSFAIAAIDGEAGYCVVEDFTEEGERKFGDIVLWPGSTGRGIGIATYLAVIEWAHSDGLAFRNDRWLSTYSARIWRKFIEKGIAEVIEPMQSRLIDFGDASTTEYTGYFRINPQ